MTQGDTLWGGGGLGSWGAVFEGGWGLGLGVEAWGGKTRSEKGDLLESRMFLYGNPPPPPPGHCGTA